MPPAIPIDRRSLPISNELADLYRENITMLYLWQNQNKLFADYTGILSWRFCEKTQLSIRQIIEWLKLNPGYDVYLVNPYPYNCHEFSNFVEEGEAVHKGFHFAAKRLLNAIQFPEYFLYEPLYENTTVYCNYWIGNKNFWKDYMSFLSKTIETIEKDNKLKYILSEITTHEKPTPMAPFVLERLFSMYLNYQKANYKILSYRAVEWEMRVYKTRLRLLRQTFENVRTELDKIENMSILSLIRFFLFRLIVRSKKMRQKIRHLKNSLIAAISESL